ncbi:hypothetical protein AAFM46_04705 [Arthrobacter sp. TMP15]|uniref:hypothetical protein n=1 Tax=Arthrobacter sp. TMP15 TaxID=3140789 RepID=UPI0031B9F458
MRAPRENDNATSSNPEITPESLRPLTLVGQRRVRQSRAQQHQQVSGEIVELVVELKDKLRDYLALNALSPTSGSAPNDTRDAVKWMENTIEDLLATVVGVEATTARTDAGHP